MKLTKIKKVKPAAVAATPKVGQVRKPTGMHPSRMKAAFRQKKGGIA